MGEEKQIEWIVVNKQGLLEAVAECAWQTDVRNKPKSEVYESIVDNKGETHLQVNEEYTRVFWNYHKCYGELIESYIKPDEDGPNEKSTTGNDQRGVLSEGEG